MAISRQLVLDSWAVLAFFENEPSGQKAADIIADANEQGISLLMCPVNAGEVWYITARQTSDAQADQLIREVENLGIEIVAVDWNMAREAAMIKSRVKMSYADCFAFALAKLHQAELVTGDPEFKQLERQIKIRWI
ncbi:MAG: type II toxin-antitoxin system VapC family toxin [Candidatus Aminicenantales bacterium]